MKQLRLSTLYETVAEGVPLSGDLARAQIWIGDQGIRVDWRVVDDDGVQVDEGAFHLGTADLSAALLASAEDLVSEVLSALETEVGAALAGTVEDLPS